MKHTFHTLSCRVTIDFDNPALYSLVQKIWPDTPPHPELKASALHYQMRGSAECGDLLRDGQSLIADVDLSRLLYVLDKDILVHLQHTHTQLYFLHGALLQRDDAAILLTGASGAGKSTTALALISSNQTRWAPMTDELAAMDLVSRRVYPYYRALGLKTLPPEPLRAPSDTVHGSCSLHVPVSQMPKPRLAPTRLAAVFAIQAPYATQYPAGAQVSPADASMTFMGNVLNGLAHHAAGMSAAVALAQDIPVFNLPRLPLAQSCDLIENCWDSLDTLT